MKLPLLVSFLLLTTALTAQSYLTRIHNRVELGDTSQLHQLILLDYTKLLGLALSVDDREVVFRLRASEEVSRIPVSQLRYLGVYTPRPAYQASVRQDSGRVVRFRRPTKPTVGFQDLTLVRTALPYGSTGRLKVNNVFYASVDWALGENGDLGVGLIGPLGFLFNQRLRFSLGPNFHLGVSNQTFLPILTQFGEEVQLFGDVQAMATVGNEYLFFNLGTGIFYQNGTGENSLPFHRFGVGGQLSPRWYLYGELGVLVDDEVGRFGNEAEAQIAILPTITAALRTRRHRWNFGVLGVVDDFNDAFVAPIPYVGYQLSWGLPPRFKRERLR